MSIFFGVHHNVYLTFWSMFFTPSPRIFKAFGEGGRKSCKPKVDLEANINPHFYRVVLQAAYEDIDQAREGYIRECEFKAFFYELASDAEMAFVWDLLDKNDECKVAYGGWQSFQSLYDPEMVHQPGGKRKGDPDYLEYPSLLAGMKLSCERDDFCSLLKQTGETHPPSSDWLLRRMEMEWSSLANLHVHWRYIMSPCPVDEAGRRYPDHKGGYSVRDKGNEGKLLADFVRHEKAVRASLNEAEVAGIRLYTGPGYEPLNKSLRCNSGRFPATQFAIDSAIGKLALSTRPCTLYRGMRKKMHPRWRAKYRTYKGIARDDIVLSDPAFFSTTSDPKTATGSDFGGPVIFVVQTGNDFSDEVAFLTTGADVEWASQYPGESEVLYPSNVLLVPQIQFKHRAVPGALGDVQGKHTYEFSIYYPWDTARNAPLLRDCFLPYANILLQHVHALEQAYLAQCKTNGHAERPGPGAHAYTPGAGPAPPAHSPVGWPVDPALQWQAWGAFPGGLPSLAPSPDLPAGPVEQGLGHAERLWPAAPSVHLRDAAPSPYLPPVYAPDDPNLPRLHWPASVAGPLTQSPAACAPPLGSPALPMPTLQPLPHPLNSASPSPGPSALLLHDPGVNSPVAAPPGLAMYTPGAGPGPGFGGTNAGMFGPRLRLYTEEDAAKLGSLRRPRCPDYLEFQDVAPGLQSFPAAHQTALAVPFTGSVWDLGLVGSTAADLLSSVGLGGAVAGVTAKTATAVAVAVVATTLVTAAVVPTSVVAARSNPPEVWESLRCTAADGPVCRLVLFDKP